ncbi:uncharacterized protein [Panulirus ornatus]|uniref:uncharacterized protein isoform X2 n=1 Tax=Panulirus ornatus TaxID=150431 RepID=UPI003A86C55A
MAFVPPNAVPGYYDTLPQYLSRNVKSASESREWHPTVRGVTTVLRITRILSGRATPSRRKQQQHVASRLRHPAQITSLRLLCRIRATLGRQVQTRRKPNVERKKSWRRYVKRSAHDPKPSRVAPEHQMRLERVADIRLTTQSGGSHNLVRYNIKARAYQRVPDDDPLLHLLTLPSRVIHKDQLLQQKVFARGPQPARPPPTPAKKVQFDVDSDSDQDMDDEKEMTSLSLDLVTREQLAGFETQANPFNFSERVSQTDTHRLKSSGVQTDPPPDTYFSDTAGVSIIYIAYERDHHQKLLDRKELDKKQEINSVMECARIDDYASLVAAGWGDGTVVVYYVRSTGAQHMIHSTPVDGKHLLPVTRIRWIDTEASEDLSLYSVSLDGRVTYWRVTPSALLPSDVLDLNKNPQLAPDQCQPHLQGIGTCLALKPDDRTQLLLGVDTGSVYQFSIACPSHSCTRYPAHTASVRDVAWNHYHNKVFISCSLDWTVKIWLQFSLSPLMTLDLGGAVAGVQWAPYSSSVFVAVTDEGRVQVYDLFFRKSYPLCSQRLLHRRQVAVSCVALNPKHPVILVGGERGYLLALKLSPNLRKIYNNPRGFDQLPHKEIELCKIERLIALNRGLGMHSGCFREDAKTDDKTRERTSAALTLVVKRKHPTDF